MFNRIVREPTAVAAIRGSALPFSFKILCYCPFKRDRAGIEFIIFVAKCSIEECESQQQ
jgi:hypothetical protein